MAQPTKLDFATLYKNFYSPISELNCGNKCSAHNDRGVPFCCDTRHTVPTAYQDEWSFLQDKSDLWRIWLPDDDCKASSLIDMVPDGQVMIACKGHAFCQRDYRSLTCRAFPFFPYITREGSFVGLSVYWEYEDRCWVISNLQLVTNRYLKEFVYVYDSIFTCYTQEIENFRAFSAYMRRVFGRNHRAIPLLHRNGFTYKITPRNGCMRRVASGTLPKSGVYKIAAAMPFSDEKIPYSTNGLQNQSAMNKEEKIR